MTKLIFQKGLMLIKQISQKSVIFVTTGILKILVLNMNLIFVMDVILLLYILREMLTEFIFGI